MKSIVLTDSVETDVALKLAGFERELVESKEDLLKTIENYISDKSIGLVLINHSEAKDIEKEINKLKLIAKKTVIKLIPSFNESYQTNIEKYVAEAIGISM